MTDEQLARWEADCLLAEKGDPLREKDLAIVRRVNETRRNA
jgi:hypothetical protein